MDLGTQEERDLEVASFKRFSKLEWFLEDVSGLLK